MTEDARKALAALGNSNVREARLARTVLAQAEQITELQDRLDGQAWEDLTAERNILRARLERLERP